MTVRKNRPQGTLEAVIAALPDRFTAPEVYTEGGQMTGLRDYMRDLSAHLAEALDTDSPPTLEVMAALGIPPSEWYGCALEAG